MSKQLVFLNSFYLCLLKFKSSELVSDPDIAAAAAERETIPPFGLSRICSGCSCCVTSCLVFSLVWCFFPFWSSKWWCASLSCFQMETLGTHRFILLNDDDNPTHIYCHTYYIPFSIWVLVGPYLQTYSLQTSCRFFAQIHHRKLIPLGHYSSAEMPPRSEAGMRRHLSGVSASALVLWLIASGLAGEQIAS